MKKLCLIFLSFNLAFVLSAKPITKETAQKVALNWYLSSAGFTKNAQVSSSVMVNQVIELQFANEILIYAINISNNSFVLVSADDSVMPILGYSSGNWFDSEKVPDGLKMLIESYKEQILFSKKSNNLSDLSTQEEWNNLLTNKISLIKANSVQPLVKTKWDQGKFYNAFCPQDSRGPDGRVPVGCVAVAMGQIMKFHNYPSKGYGNQAFQCNYGLIQENFSNILFNWTNMPDSLTAPNDDVAKLLYYSGVSSYMSYGYEGSATHKDNMINGLTKHFGYSGDVTFAWKDWDRENVWSPLLKNELDNSRPIYYEASQKDATYGHAWVIDGYDNNGLFHCNWGWGGLFNGYFVLGNFTPGNYNFSVKQIAVYNIRPAHKVIETNTTWNGLINVDGNTTIADNATLTIMPGTKLQFNGPYLIQIHGSIKAIGTKSDSIYFTSVDTTVGWRGIYLQGPLPDSVIIKYCKFENARYKHNYRIDDWKGQGAALKVIKVANIKIDNCSFINNSSFTENWTVCEPVGGAIYTEGCSIDRTNLEISNSSFRNNNSNRGGAIAINTNADVLIKNCKFNNNSKRVITQSTLNHQDKIRIINNEFISNKGGVLFLSGGDIKVIGNVMNNNIGGTYLENLIYIGHLDGNLNFVNNTFANNSMLSYVQGTVVHSAAKNITMKNCLFWNNTSFPSQKPLLISLDDFQPTQGTISYSLMEGGINNNIKGNVTTSNILSSDPKFVSSGPFTCYLSSSSPCINNGDPNTTVEELGVSVDLMGNNRINQGRIDIGAYEFDSNVVSVNEQIEQTIPKQFSISQNYPNPFNPSTTIKYEIPYESNVTIELFNSIGQKISTLIRNTQALGNYKVNWNASNFSSGVYFYRIEAKSLNNNTSYNRTIKMLLLK